MDKLYTQKDVNRIVARAITLQETKKELYTQEDIKLALEELEIEKNIITQSIEEYVPKQIPKKFNFFFNRRKDKDNFIYVPSINLYVAKKRIHLNKDWNKCQELLHNDNERMPTIPEFIEFLKYTKENYQDIYKEITEVRSPWRAEWLDADFKVKGKDLYINYYAFDSQGNIIKKSELLDKDTLMKDKTLGISLDDYLDSGHTNQGPPSKKVKSGELCYWCPEKDNNSVAGFYAGSVRTLLSCDGSPSGHGSGLGVRAVRRE